MIIMCSSVFITIIYLFITIYYRLRDDKKWKNFIKPNSIWSYSIWTFCVKKLSKYVLPNCLRIKKKNTIAIWGNLKV